LYCREIKFFSPVQSMDVRIALLHNYQLITA